MADNINRVRDAIVEVLDAYGATYVVGPSHVTFTFKTFTRKIAVRGGDFRAHKNAKTRVRRLLHSLGAEPLATETTEEPIADIPEDDSAIDNEAIEETPPMADVEPKAAPM